MTNLFHYRQIVELERHRRIKIAVAAYAYEFENDPIMDDAEFDRECLKIRGFLDTGNAVLDEFFRTKFNPFTGMWIHQHPELEKVAQTYQKWYRR